MLVVDASAIVEVLLPSSHTVEIAKLMSGERLLAPHLAATEVMSAIRRLEAAGTIDRDAATGALTDFADLELSYVWSPEWIGEAWELRDRLRVTDALYAVAARSTRSRLLTVDYRLARALRDSSVVVVTP